jgi:hypothetical protein
MKSPVQLYLRVPLPDGTYPYLKAVYASNGRIRPHRAIKDGKVVSFLCSCDYLRYHIDGKRAWEPVGDDASLADINLRRKNLKLQELALGHSSTSCLGSATTHFPFPSTPGIESAKPEQATSRFCSMMRSMRSVDKEPVAEPSGAGAFVREGETPATSLLRRAFFRAQSGEGGREIHGGIDWIA